MFCHQILYQKWVSRWESTLDTKTNVCVFNLAFVSNVIRAIASASHRRSVSQIEPLIFNNVDVTSKFRQILSIFDVLLSLQGHSGEMKRSL